MSNEIKSSSEQNSADFAEYKLAVSLPDRLIIYGTPKIPYGAAVPGFDISTVDIDSNRWLMEKMFFSTHTRIYDVLHLQTVTQLFFIGYKCGKCQRVFLVPEKVQDDSDVANSVRHACHE